MKEWREYVKTELSMSLEEWKKECQGGCSQERINASKGDLEEELQYYNAMLSGNLYESLNSRDIRREILKRSSEHYYLVRALFLIALAMILWFYCWFVVDVNSRVRRV